MLYRFLDRTHQVVCTKSYGAGNKKQVSSQKENEAVEVLEAPGDFRSWVGCFAFTERSGKGEAGNKRGCIMLVLSSLF